MKLRTWKFCLIMSPLVFAAACAHVVGHPPMRSETVLLSTVPVNVMAKFRSDYADSKVIGIERCFIKDNTKESTIFYAVRFEDGGKQREALLTPEAKLTMDYDKGELPPRHLLLTNSIGPDTEFRLFRRKPDGEWSDGTSFPRTAGVQVLRALEGARLWDGASHVHGQSMPYLAIGLDWSNDASQRKTHAVWFCQGNRLVWHTDSYYEVPESSWKFVDGAFPENQ